MQVLGNMYNEFNISSNQKVNIIVATSGDTGSAAISALNDRKISMYLFYILIIKFLIYKEKL